MTSESKAWSIERTLFLSDSSHFCDFYRMPTPVRGDGAIRNREGRWATQSTNSHFYCLGPAACLCGGCNGFCGPKDGCNCASCKLLDGSDSYGASELALMVKQEREQSRLSMAESVKTLKLETEVCHRCCLWPFVFWGAAPLVVGST